VKQVLVLGAGRVGAVIAADLAREQGLRVRVADASEGALAAARERAGGRVTVERADLSDPAAVARLAAAADVVVGALPSRFGFAALGAVIEARRPCVDISFTPQDARAHAAAARAAGVCVVVDMGVAPGMSHLLAGHAVARLGGARRLRILVGGLPVERRLPFQYKAGFAPSDVIEEYTRPARTVEEGRVRTRPALSIVERVEFEGLGTLEAGLTDGLRSLVETLDVPQMSELTLRWPGHYELMRAFGAAGLFSSEALDVAGQRVRPLDVTSKLLVEAWTFAPGEEDLTAMRVEVESDTRRIVFEVLDRYDRASETTSMARTTAFPCAIVARLLADGSLRRSGVFAPEEVAGEPGLLERVLQGHRERGVAYRERDEPVG
jgi:saccharopine dehydrogenase-like NADP-dependent oxidoreductase